MTTATSIIPTISSPDPLSAQPPQVTKNSNEIIVALEAIKKSNKISNELMGNLDPTRVAPIPHETPEVDCDLSPSENLSKITEESARIRTIKEEEALRSKSTLEDTLLLGTAGSTQAVYSLVSSVTASINMANPEILAMAQPTNFSLGMNTTMGGFEIISGFCMAIIGFLEIKSALKDMKASKTENISPVLQNLEVFKAGQANQKFRLGMGLLDCAAGLGVIAIGALTIAAIFGALPATVGGMPILLFLGLCLTFILLVPCIVPIIDLSQKVRLAYVTKDDIGHRLELDTLKSKINSLQNLDDEQILLLSKHLAIDMLIMLALENEKDSNGITTYYDKIRASKSPYEVRLAFNELLAKFEPQEMQQLTAAALEYLKSRIGEEAANNLIGSFHVMHNVFNKLTSGEPVNTITELTTLKNENIPKIQQFISDWNTANVMRLSIQLLYVACFLISLASIISPATIAGILTLLQSLGILGAGAIPLILDCGVRWRWVRGAAVVADPLLPTDFRIISRDIKIAKFTKKQQKLSKANDLIIALLEALQGNNVQGLESSQQVLAEKQEEFRKNVSKEIEQINALYQSIDDLAKLTTENEALKELITQLINQNQKMIEIIYSRLLLMLSSHRITQLIEQEKILEAAIINSERLRLQRPNLQELLLQTTTAKKTLYTDLLTRGNKYHQPIISSFLDKVDQLIDKATKLNIDPNIETEMVASLIKNLLQILRTQTEAAINDSEVIQSAPAIPQ